MLQPIFYFYKMLPIGIVVQSPMFYITVDKFCLISYVSFEKRTQNYENLNMG